MSRIYLSKADVTHVEEDFVVDAVRSGWVTPLGPHVDAFEAEVAARVGVTHALALSSGTAALELALMNVGAGAGTIVVVPTMTFIASASAVVHSGAQPVFVDVHMSDGNVDTTVLIEAVDQLRAEGEIVAAFMAVDLFGRCVDYEDVTAALAARGVPIVEDAAEALGATYRGKAAGSFGAAAALSFNGNKIMTTSGGGMLLSDDEELIERSRYLSAQARQPVDWYEHTEVGFNYRLSNVLAALGRAQLSRLDEMMARRRAIHARYVESLADAPGLRFLGADDTEDRSDNCWLTAITLDPTRASCSPTTLIKALDRADIEARYLWKPMHAQPVFKGERAFLTGVSDHLFATGLTLPSGSALSDGEVDRVVIAVRSAMVSD